MMSYDFFGNEIKDKKSRDSRRAFTQTQKNEIRHQQNEKCAKCHEKLDSRDIEYDHKKPWASGGRTISVNGRALCGSCHNKVTHKANLKNVDKKTKKKSDNDLFGLKPPKFF